MNDWISVHVAAKREAACDIAAFTLAPADGGELPAWQPGAHVDVKLPGGLVRQYSLCGPAGDRKRYEIGVLRDPNGRGGSLTIHDEVHEGDTLEISAPRNLFPLVAQERALLFAGGIGVTPILAMAEHLAAAQIDFAMHYCVRSEDRAAFRDRLSTTGSGGAVQLHFDDQPGTAMDTAMVLASPTPGTHLYVCGPDGFMDHVLTTARNAGWPESHIHFERFSAPVSEPGEDAVFEIAIEGEAQTIAVAPGQTALEALTAAGFDIPVSCEQGICGTCLTDVIDGIPDHRDMFLSDAEHAANDCFTPCCSRALTPRLTIRI